MPYAPKLHNELLGREPIVVANSEQFDRHSTKIKQAIGESLTYATLAPTDQFAVICRSRFFGLLLKTEVAKIGTYTETPEGPHGVNLPTPEEGVFYETETAQQAEISALTREEGADLYAAVSVLNGKPELIKKNLRPYMPPRPTEAVM